MGVSAIPRWHRSSWLRTARPASNIRLACSKRTSFPTDCCMMRYLSLGPWRRQGRAAPIGAGPRRGFSERQGASEAFPPGKALPIPTLDGSAPVGEFPERRADTRLKRKRGKEAFPHVHPRPPLRSQGESLFPPRDSTSEACAGPASAPDRYPATRSRRLGGLVVARTTNSGCSTT